MMSLLIIGGHLSACATGQQELMQLCDVRVDLKAAPRHVQGQGVNEKNTITVPVWEGFRHRQTTKT